MQMNVLSKGISSIAHFTLISIALLAPAVFAQQSEKSAQKPNSHTATTSESKAQGSSQQIVLPIVGKGTTNYLPVFTGTYAIGNSLVSQTGNGLNVNGTVNAVSFTGSGSGLSGVNASTLGGVSSSAFAQTGASNNFTADQTITGNLNLTGYLDSTLFLQGNLTDANGQEGANVLGGFAGNSQYPGNSIAPGVIGATIAGGGGAYDASLLPAHKRSLQRGQMRGHQALRSPFAPRSLQGDGSESAEQPDTAEQASSMNTGVVSGANGIVINPGTTCCPSWATIAGGLKNTASGFAATVGGGFANTASGNYSIIAGGDGNTASASEATVAGGTSNTASGSDSAVGGGSSNMASGSIGSGFLGYSTVAGGEQNTASGSWSFVGGGQFNTASSSADYAIGYSTVGGGGSNVASGDVSTIAGGAGNTASGQYSTIPGGSTNVAAGDVSFAAGCQATANNYGSFVWSSALSPYFQHDCGPVQDTGPGQFVAASWGGFYFYTSSSGASGSGATLPAGSGSWSSLSDRNAKTNFLSIDPSALLEKLAAMPVSTWNYKTQADSIRHLGPTAQDFHEAFGLGEDDKHISTVDAEGVALAGIQALYAEMKRSLEEKDREISDLRARLAQLESSAHQH